MYSHYRVCCLYEPPAVEERMVFTRYVGYLLGTQVETRQASSRRDWINRYWIGQMTEGYDLVIVHEPDRLWWQRLWAIKLMRKFVELARSSVLIVRRARWPIKRMLLYMEGGMGDSLTLDLVARLARSSEGSITVLAILPPVPAMFDGLARMQQDLDTVMASDTPLGSALRQASQRFEGEDIKSSFQLHQGAFNWEFRCGMIESNSDLIAVSCTDPNCLDRWLRGDPVKSLLRWSRRPILVAKPTVA